MARKWSCTRIGSYFGCSPSSSADYHVSYLGSGNGDTCLQSRRRYLHRYAWCHRSKSSAVPKRLHLMATEELSQGNHRPRPAARSDDVSSEVVHRVSVGGLNELIGIADDVVVRQVAAALGSVGILSAAKPDHIPAMVQQYTLVYIERPAVIASEPRHVGRIRYQTYSGVQKRRRLSRAGVVTTAPV